MRVKCIPTPLVLAEKENSRFGRGRSSGRLMFTKNDHNNGKLLREIASFAKCCKASGNVPTKKDFISVVEMDTELSFDKTKIGNGRRFGPFFNPFLQRSLHDKHCSHIATTFDTRSRLSESAKRFTQSWWQRFPRSPRVWDELPHDLQELQ